MEVEIAGDLMTLNMGPQHPSTPACCGSNCRPTAVGIGAAHIGYLPLF
jgi:hypothetical protein